MDRRLFLKGSAAAITSGCVGGFIGGFLSTRKWGKPPIDVTFVDHLGRWIPDEWIEHANIFASRIRYDLIGKCTSLDPADIKVFYDTCSWRSMQHNWIGYFEVRSPEMGRYCTETGFPIEGVKTKDMIMMGTDRAMPYPHNDEWNSLKLYGKTVEALIQHQMKG